jgi:hypothetical protein
MWVLPLYIHSILLWEWRWCYGIIISSINMVTIFRISNSYYHSSCLNHNFGYYFEQIKKHHITLSQSYVVFIIKYMVAHISVAFISYFYYTHLKWICQILKSKIWLNLWALTEYKNFTTINAINILR